MGFEKFKPSFEDWPDDIKRIAIGDLLKQGLEVCRSSFARFQEYFQLMERLIEEALEHEVGFLKQTAEKLPEEKRDHFWMWNYPAYLENLPPLLRSSFLIALYSLDEELWKELTDFTLVRNCIVHNDGFINTNKESQLRTIVNKYQEISLEYDRIIPSEEYCWRMLTKCWQLLEDLYNESLKRIK